MLQRLWATTGVYDTFFTICVYAFYRKEFGYIKELWQHVNPPDASASWANVNLVRFSIGFLTYQMMYNLLVDWPIEGYHGGEMYVLRYYLLCLAYTLRQPNKDWNPMAPPFTRTLVSQRDEYLVVIGQELSATHRFLNDLPHYVDRALKEYDAVVSMSEEWDDVFNGQTSAALKGARDWLSDTARRQDWKGKAESIIKNLPLDNIRVEAYKRAALEYYQSQCQVDQLATTEDNGGEAPTELRGSCLICPDKRDFTLIGLGKPHEVGRKVGFAAVGQVVRAEVARIAETILENKATKPTSVKQLTFGQVVEAIRKIDEAGYRATVLLASDQQITSAWRNDPDFRVHVSDEGDNRYLLCDESTRLKILELDDNNHAFVLDRSVGIWTRVKPLEIEVTGCDKNPLAVQIVAHEVADYQLLTPEAVRVLRVGPPSDQSESCTLDTSELLDQ